MRSGFLGLVVAASWAWLSSFSSPPSSVAHVVRGPQATPGHEIRADELGRRAQAAFGIEVAPPVQMGVPAANWLPLGPFGDEEQDEGVPLPMKTLQLAREFLSALANLIR